MMIDLNNEGNNNNEDNNENQLNETDRNDPNNELKRTSKRKQTFERRNIRNIIDDEKFGKDAKEAQQAEFERLKRVQEREHNIKLHHLLSEDIKINSSHIFQPSNFNKDASYLNNFIKIFPQIQNNNASSSGQRYKRNNCTPKQYHVVPDNCVIFLDDSDEEREKRAANQVEIIEISDGEDGDDNIEDTIDQEKVDTKNVDRDANGNILINVAHPNDEEDFYLSDKISKYIKPHQVSGIRFLYENLIESKKQFKEADGFGCILAHSMGLGKTIQIIGFLDILFRCCEAKSTLVIVPINTIQNWQAEIENWLPTNETAIDIDIKTENVIGNDFTLKLKKERKRSFNLFVIKDCHKTIESRHAVIKDWMKQGGVMLIGYEMFRLLVTYRQNKTTKSKRKDKETLIQIQKKKVFIDVDLEEKRNNIYQDFLKALVNPGPEVIICDEGHRIKNSEASISKALKAVRTHRRVVMTGYPLQNNLTEYWCMVDFVRPNYLGSKHEFNNMFQRPIENGQCVDSTLEDRKLMQGRAHVLHELLQGFVQRRSHAVLKANLPPKWEYVIMIKMSPIQRKLYSDFMEQLLNGNLYNWSQNSTLKIYAMCCKIWNHPDILFRVLQEKMLSNSDPDFDFDIEDDVNISTKVSSAKGKSKSQDIRNISVSSPLVQDVTEEDYTSRLDSDLNFTDTESNFSKFLRKNNDPRQSNLPHTSRNLSSNLSYTAYLEMLTKKVTEDLDNPYSWINEDSWKYENGEDYLSGCKENSGKIMMLLSLLDDCLSFGDKMLVFSQSLLTLDIIEIFLKQNKLPNNSLWEKNKTYFRLDGSTSSSERERMINSFNSPNSQTHLFLLSTRAGCLGINLIGANRVVVFDASWNPCHDCQAVCRVYRYGQIKPCFIYRLVTDNTMEKKIYDRQVTKQGISDRVVDESNPGQHFLRSQVQVLIDYEDLDISGLSPTQIEAIENGCGEEDPILGRVLKRHKEWVTKLPFTHESLLIDRKDYRLTKREKRKAKESYERDKRQSLYYQKNSYSDFYIKTSVPTANGYIPPRPPIAPYRSSIMSNVSNNTSIVTNFPNNYNHTKQHRNYVRQPMVHKSNSALMREFEQARLRCGFPKDVAPFSIAVSEDEDDAVVTKRSKNDIAPDLSIFKNHQEIIPKVTKINTEETVKTQEEYKHHNENDTSNESRSDRNFKVIKITATTEMNFPATPSIVTSHASGTKISSGEPLEIIYTSKGKFLRVPRTGDLFAIKDNKDRKSVPIETCSTLPNHNNSFTETVDLTKSIDDTKSDTIPSENKTNKLKLNCQFQESSKSFTSASSKHFQNSTPISSVNETHKETLFSPLCCQCKVNGNSLNFIVGCTCLCHLPNNSVQSPIVFSTVPSSLFQAQKPQIYFDPQQTQQSMLPQQQFVINNLPGGTFATPFFYDDKGLISVISTPVVGQPLQWQQNQFPIQFSVDNNVSKNNPVYSNFDFSTL